MRCIFTFSEKSSHANGVQKQKQNKILSRFY